MAEAMVGDVALHLGGGRVGVECRPTLIRGCASRIATHSSRVSSASVRSWSANP